MSQQPLADLLAALAADNAQPAELISAFIAEHGADLSALEDGALDAFNAVYGDGTLNYTAENLADLQRVTQVLDAVRTTRQQRDTETAERAAQVAELAARAKPAPVEAAPPAEVAPAVEETPAAPEAAAAVAEQQPVAAAAATPAATPPAAPVRRATSGSSDFQRLAEGAGTVSPWAITASADIPGVPTGAEIRDLDHLAKVVESRLTPMTKLGGGIKHQLPIATMQLSRDGALVASGTDSEERVRAIVDHAANEKRLEGGSLTASGVWCAPSEQIYTLCDDISTTDGLIDLPSITVSRGGIKYPKSPNYSDVYTQLLTGSWEWDPAKTDNDPKPCLEIPCPDMGECRLTPYGLCITTDILVNHAWPELVKEWTSRLLTAQAHLINSKILKKIQAGSTPVAFKGTAPKPYQPGGASSALDILELQATYIRTKNRMRKDATVEVVLPNWTQAFLRADLAKRTGVDLISVNNSRLDAFFRDRALNVQYVYDWFDIDATKAPTGWPTTLPALMYVAGGWVAARQDVLELSAVYDSTNLAQNKFTGLWSEEAICVINRCYDSLYITIDVCADGVTAAPVETVCPAI